MLIAVASEYDPVFAPRADGPESGDLAEVKRLFAAASRPYLSAAFPWFFWSLVLPSAAPATSAPRRHSPASSLSGRRRSCSAVASKRSSSTAIAAGSAAARLSAPGR